MITDMMHTILAFFASLPHYFTKNPKELLYDWMGGNESIFLGINGIRDGEYDQLMRAISWVGEYEHFPYYLAALLGWVFIKTIYKLSKREQIKHYLSFWVGIFAVLIVGFVVNATVTNSLKSYFSYPRPYIALAATETVYKLEATEPKDNFRSFPSGHVAFITFMVVALWPLFGTKMAWTAVGLIFMMAWSRISLGMHFPADVIASVLITAPLIMVVGGIVKSLLRRILGLQC